MSLQERVEELEAKLCFAEDLLETLNLTVFRQQEELALLRAQVQHLARRLPAGGAERRSAEEELPPHW